MQDDVSEGAAAPIQGDTPAGIPISALGQIIEAMGSRRMLLGSMFGAMAGGLPFALARSAAAAPPEVRGSSNIPLKVYNNTTGTYVLFSDGSITRVDKDESPTDPTRYAPVTRFRKRNQVDNHAKGSPNVAVDILQDQLGTYVLFADGTFRQPPGGPGASGYGTVEFFYGKTRYGQIHNNSGNFQIIAPNRIRFNNPFREAPFTWAFRNPEAIILMSGWAGVKHATATEWDISDFNQSNMDGGFFGIGLH